MKKIWKLKNKLYEYDLTKMNKQQIKCIQKAKKLKTIRLQERDLVSERGLV